VTDFLIRFQAQWSSLKIPMMRRDLEVMVRRAGAKNVRFEVVSEVEPEPRPLLELTCSACGNGSAIWKAGFFTSCPKCGRRDTVSKVPPQNLPTQQELVVLAETAAPEVADPSVRPARHFHKYDENRTCACGARRPGRPPRKKSNG